MRWLRTNKHTLMSLATRIIPCLDVRDNRVVKGVNFGNIIDAGDPVSCAQSYNDALADELVLLDITASIESRSTWLTTVRTIADTIFIPFTVGGGISTLDDIYRLLDNGADKVSLNSTALKNPQLIADCARTFGSQCIVIAIDAKRHANGKWHAYTHGGRNDTGIDALTWAKQACDLGAGEVLLTSMDTDGVQTGFDLALTKAVADVVLVPVIASGGAGELTHFSDAVTLGKADALLAASVFHFGTFAIHQVKEHLQEKDIAVRL